MVGVHDGELHVEMLPTIHNADGFSICGLHTGLLILSHIHFKDPVLSR